MKIRIVFLAWFLFTAFNSSTIGQESIAENSAAAYPDDHLSKIREAATSLPGEHPLAINFSKVAESHRTYADIIDGGDNSGFVSARTAFQIVFPDRFIMVDSGMDEEVHRYYGFGRDEPYWQDKNNDVQAALRGAAKIIITHEHGDHVAGVIRSEHIKEIAPKTLLTREQLQTLLQRPQLPQIALTKDQAKDYVILDYDEFLPVAPGVVLIKSAGHTTGHQMVYVQLANAKEFLFIGDIGWSLDNIIQLKLRPKRTIERIGEDAQALRAQMRWIKEQADNEGIIVIPSHDNLLLNKLARDQVLGSSLSL